MIGRYVLWPVCCFCWKVPGLRLVGNGISSLRFLLYQRFGWEWI